MSETANILEAVLFAHGDSLSLEQLSAACGEAKAQTRIILAELKRSYDENARGIALKEIGGRYQLSTRPMYHEYVKRLVQTPSSRALTAPLMETLAIIAYKQPATKAMIEEVRGVNADHAVNKLMELNLICERGRLDIPGKPIVFGTTEDFLRHFGFGGLKDLPEALAPQDNDEMEVLG
jgi:segregation and condensation protein B